MSAKIEVAFDPSNQEHIVALTAFLSVVGGNETTTSGPVVDIKVSEEEEVKPKKKAKKKAPKVEEEKAEEVDDSSPDVSIEAIRELVTSKVKKHKAVIKEKLSELDAPNVTSLDEDHYDEFYAFLKEL
jgi:hypothetical protein